jgi:type I restriction enzyme S subunit
LRIPNVQGETINLDDIKYATDPVALRPEGAVEPGDLLFVRTNGSRGLIGRGAVITQPLTPAHHFASYLIRLRLVNLDVVPRWTGLAWHAPVVRKQMLADVASSAGQYNVSLSAATGYAIPLPPLAEQRRILSEVDRVTSLVTASGRTLRAAEEHSARLRQSILRWAFEGKLVDQDPNDEPATVLLERIKAERAAATPPKTARRVLNRRAKKTA